MNITIEKHDILAQIASNNVEKTILNSINTMGKANIVLATGNSQLLFLKELRKKLIPWDKVVIFHLDEYIGLKKNHHSSFRKYLIDNIIKHINPKQFHPIKADAE
ncbi:MAG: 6-phosphogluconolactonase, partial [Flavobacteriaceae bacterium]|nr:6-phosphogluconolactonase [Flavobacteriaceae bacterium]